MTLRLSVSHWRNDADVKLFTAENYAEIQCILTDAYGPEGPTTWELGVDELLIHTEDVSVTYLALLLS